MCSSWEVPPTIPGTTGLGYFDFVPTKLVDTSMIETASDDWFVDFNTDGLPEIPIGRLPVHYCPGSCCLRGQAHRATSRAQLQPRRSMWPVPGMRNDDFEGCHRAMETLTSLVPEEVFHAKLGDQTAPRCVTKLKEGAGLVTYLGHGSVALWADNVLDTTSADELTNTTLPLLHSLDLSQRLLHHPHHVDSLATTLLTDTAGGAVGVVASSTLTEFAPQGALGGCLARRPLHRRHRGRGARPGKACRHRS